MLQQAPSRILPYLPFLPQFLVFYLPTYLPTYPPLGAVAKSVECGPLVHSIGSSIPGRFKLMTHKNVYLLLPNLALLR